MALVAGTKAPDFTSHTDGKNIFTLSEYFGNWIVLYFYPKDDTEDCTIQACSFRDNMERIKSEGAVVLGVSPDKVTSHNKFKGKFELNFSLIADVGKVICGLYDVLKQKSMFGKKYMGVIRTTFIINPDGNIAHVFSNVEVEGHVDAVLAKLKELKGLV